MCLDGRHKKLFIKLINENAFYLYIFNGQNVHCLAEVP